MAHHELKIHPEFFRSVMVGRKRFEIRENDRRYAIDDTVTLNEYNADGVGYTGREINVTIVYITDFEQKPGWVVFGFDLMQA